MIQNNNIVLEIENIFKKSFPNYNPLTIFSPGRINIIGEHTDYNQGFVLPAAINLGIVVAIQKNNSDNCKVIAANKNESIQFNSQEYLKPIEKGGWRNYVLGIIIELQKREIFLPGFNLVFGGNIPGGAGLSSSAALENGIVYALNTLFNLKLSKHEMVLISQNTEHNSVGVHCGIMDQYASMFGKKEKAIFLDCKNTSSQYVNTNLYNYELLLINSNVKHDLSEDDYNDRRDTCEKIAALLQKTSLREISIPMLNSLKGKITDDEYQMGLYILQENDRVIKAKKALETNNINLLGELLYESHNGLKLKYKVSCKELDFLVSEAEKNQNVIGSRMIGGGFGGCTINLIKSDKSADFIQRITHKFKSQFNTECTPIKVNISEGTRLINQF